VTLARTLEICDAVVDAIGTAWDPTSPDAVSREYGVEVGLSKDYASILLTGRKVYVFPTSYEAPGLIDREVLMNAHGVAVLICERYTNSDGSTADPGLPPKAWMDERVLFVQDKIYKVLRNPHLVLLDTVIPVPDELGSIDLVYDRDLYLSKRAFWSYGFFNFQEATEP